MQITLNRILANKYETLGKMTFPDGYFCYTLEDEERLVKVYGETRIPSGTYEIKYRPYGTWFARIKALITDAKGSLQLMNVPKFDGILIHYGNSEKDTAGCILVGESNIIGNRYFVKNSRVTYKKIHAKIAAELNKGNKVFITILDK